MTKKTYQQLQAELEQIVERMERGAYDELEDLLSDHEQGMKLVESLEDKLAQAKLTITKASDQQKSAK